MLSIIKVERIKEYQTKLGTNEKCSSLQICQSADRQMWTMNYEHLQRTLVEHGAYEGHME